MQAAQVRQAAGLRSLALVNPRSGGWIAHCDSLRAFEATGGLVWDIADARGLAAALATAAKAGRNRLIVVGGDGSISRVINVLRDDAEQFEIAIVPGGTGNDLARSLGIPLDDPPAAWALAVYGAAVDVDKISFRGHAQGYFVNSITAGFGGSQTSQVPNELKSLWGKIAYWLSAASQLVEMPEIELLLKLDDHDLAVRTLGFWLANGRTVGGGFTVAPSAMLNDGLIDVVVIPALPPLELVGASVDLTFGEHENSANILTFQAQKVALSTTPAVPLSVDGEPAQATSLECHVLPRSLKLIVGANDAAVSQDVNPA